MAEFKLYGTIGDDGWSWDFITASHFSDFLDTNKDESEIKIRINSNGGLVSDAWTIYDLLKNSGKKIITVNEGNCYSSATIIFLAADKENRSSFENADFGIHFPMIDAFQMGYLNSEQLESIAADLKEDNDKILNLYEKNSTKSREDLSDMMSKETTFGAEKAKEYGFISEIVGQKIDYIKYKAVAKFNHKINLIDMSLGKTILDKFNSLEEKFNKYFPAKTNFIITTPEGTEITVEKESGEIAVGDTASPDGSFVLENGDTVVISEGKVESITPETEEVDELTQAKADLEAANAKIAEMQTTIDSLTAAKAEMESTVNDVKELYNEMKSMKVAFTPAGRTKTPKAPESKDELKDKVNAIKEGSRFAKK